MGKGTNMNLACPIDNKDDSIQKVSAVVSGGQATGTFSGPTGGTVSYDGKMGSVSGYSTLSGSSSSRLAQLLAPPPEPAKPSGFGGWWFVLWIPAYIGLGYWSVLWGLPGYGVLSIGGSIRTTNDLLGRIVGIIGVILMVVGFLAGLYIGIRFLMNLDRNKRAQKEPAYQLEKTRWDKAVEKWNRLYYCHKHDIVFDPEKSETCAPNSLKEFLYRTNGG